MLVDSHCHLDRLDLTPFDGRMEQLLAHAADNGVSHFLCVAIDLDNVPVVRALAERFPNVYATVGVHPNEQGTREVTFDELVALAAHPKVLGIGETGLDYYRSQGEVEWQRDRFRTHIAAAKAARKPLVIHCREAKEDTMRMLEEEGAAEVGGVMHCFVEDWETAVRALDLGFYISFSGIVTFRTATELKEVTRRVPGDRLLVETDAPYLAPVPYRGKSNVPGYVRHVAEHIAELRGESFEEVARRTTGNFCRLFKIDL
jgi:TatD DNase family protein